MKLASMNGEEYGEECVRNPQIKLLCKWGTITSVKPSLHLNMNSAVLVAACCSGSCQAVKWVKMKIKEMFIRRSRRLSSQSPNKYLNFDLKWSQMPNQLKRRHHSCGVGTKWRGKKSKFKSFLLSNIKENVRSLENKIEEFSWEHNRNVVNAELCVFHRDAAAGKRFQLQHFSAQLSDDTTDDCELNGKMGRRWDSSTS